MVHLRETESFPNQEFDDLRLLLFECPVQIRVAIFVYFVRDILDLGFADHLSRLIHEAIQEGVVDAVQPAVVGHRQQLHVHAVSLLLPQQIYQIVLLRAQDVVQRRVAVVVLGIHVTLRVLQQGAHDLFLLLPQRHVDGRVPVLVAHVDVDMAVLEILGLIVHQRRGLDELDGHLLQPPLDAQVEWHFLGIVRNGLGSCLDQLDGNVRVLVEDGNVQWCVLI
mmetsp:Transcript_81327/g.136095  ORF Transcript_81327/g.136095 Transcript_81327/m.136095 type:complete len:222 (+) Transcript_81327:1551-2216(+)